MITRNQKTSSKPLQSPTLANTAILYFLGEASKNPPTETRKAHGVATSLSGPLTTDQFEGSRRPSRDALRLLPDTPNKTLDESSLTEETKNRENVNCVITVLPNVVSTINSIGPLKWITSSVIYSWTSVLLTLG